MIRKGVKHRPPQKAIVLKRRTAFGRGDQFWQPKVVWGDQIWQLKVVLPRPLLAAKCGPQTTFREDYFWRDRLRPCYAATSHELRCEEERAMEALPWALGFDRS